MKKSTNRNCTVAGCPSEVRCKGLCNAHYHVLKQSRKMKPCGCGCGEQTAHTFKWGHHTRLFSNEEQSRRAQQNDGTALRDTGQGKTYRKLRQRHEHRVVAEQKIGRPLQAGEIVHHRDGQIRNNAPDNLEVMTQADHMRLHFPEMLAARKAKYGT